MDKCKLKIETNSEQETMNVGEKIGLILKKDTTIFLDGDLGAGKTHFTKGLVKAMGSKDLVSSPTFSLINVYETYEYKIYHIDAYRLKSLEEAMDAGLGDAFMGDGITIVEWGELIAPLAQGDIINVKIKVIGETKRLLEIEGDF